MKPLYILKMGGSVVTYKNRPGFSVRRNLLKKVASALKETKKIKDFDLILIHGAGSLGHQLAHKYKLKEGVNGDSQRMQGSLISRLANQKLNLAIADVLFSENLPVVSAHTASLIVQNNKKISSFNIDVIKQSLKNGCIPILYGEMVFDERLGMTICSGDAIAPYLARKLKAQKMFFASDIDGIFDKDPYKNEDAKLIKEIGLADAKAGKKLEIAGSHNVDVTGGLLGKIKNIDLKKGSSLKSVEIFNGLKAENYKNVVLGEKFSHTTILL